MNKVCDYQYEAVVHIESKVDVLEYKYVTMSPVNDAGVADTQWEEGDNLVYTIDQHTHDITLDHDWKEIDGSRLIRSDLSLLPYISQLRERMAYNKLKMDWLSSVTTHEQRTKQHNYLGFTRGEKCIIYREWAPNASKLSLIGEFNHWNEDAHVGNWYDGVWQIKLYDRDDGTPLLHKGDEIKAVVKTWGGERLLRVPAFATRAEQRNSPIFSGVYWPVSSTSYDWKFDRMGKFKDNVSPLIYELHIGMSGREERVASYREFTDEVLPRIVSLGYNTLQIMAVMEHAYYGSFGYHVTSFYAASSRFGPPEDLMYLVDKAHGYGVRVVMDLVHSHACKNEEDGMGRWDGNQSTYFHHGSKGEHPVWDSKCFDYGKKEVISFLLSNLRFWVETYRFDGFRFDGITSMMYHHHGLGDYFHGYESYFGEHVDNDAVFYLQIANDLLTELDAISIAEDVSGMPALWYVYLHLPSIVYIYITACVLY